MRSIWSVPFLARARWRGCWAVRLGAGAAGPIETWSPTLRTMIPFLLANRFPLLLWWGPEFIQIYNDSYRPVLGVKHLHSLGQPARDCWPEIWDVIGPLMETPFNGVPPPGVKISLSKSTGMDI